MFDYSEALGRLEEALGRQYSESPFILGEPGESLACKIDPFYYLCLRPGFLNYLAKWAGMLPRRAALVLAKSGNLVLGPQRRRLAKTLVVFDELRGRPFKIKADFLLADFLDRSLAIYGGEPDPPPVSRLKIHLSQRETVEQFFLGKSPPQSLAFGEFIPRPI